MTGRQGGAQPPHLEQGPMDARLPGLEMEGRTVGSLVESVAHEQSNSTCRWSQVKAIWSPEGQISMLIHLFS
jgi:hypothetical protein